MESSERHSHPGRESPPQESSEQRLLARVRELEGELRVLQADRAKAVPDPHRPSKRTLILLTLALLTAIAAAFTAGYLPKRKVAAEVQRESETEANGALPVRVAAVRRSPARSQLRLPGAIQAMTEAPVLARADGYIKQRLVDIGDKVQSGQLLAEIEAPELDQQVRQAEAAREQASAAFEQAQASRQQGLSNEELARVTAARWANLVKRGVVSRQENDQFQAQYRAQSANVAALSKAVEAASNNAAAVEANLQRIEQLRSYLKVRAPFSGVVTLRNVDVGTLVTSGNTLLFRMAETRTLRTFINVPQIYAGSMRPGVPATLTVSDRPGVRFTGKVARSANSLDPATRTMLVEIHVPNRDGSLLPGMYVQVDVDASRAEPPLLVDAEAVQVRGDGIFVATVGADQRVHQRTVRVARDFGKDIEIVAGLQEGEVAVINPSDAVREGVLVKPVPQEQSERGPGAAGRKEANR